MEIVRKNSDLKIIYNYIKYKLYFQYVIEIINFE